MSIYEKWKNRLNELATQDMHLGDDLILLRRVKTIQYKIGPFSADMTIVFYIRKGYINITIDMIQYHVEPYSIVVVLPGQIFQVTEVSSEIDSSVIIQSTNFTKSCFSDYATFNKLHTLTLHQPVVKLTETAIRGFELYIQTIETLFLSTIETYKLETAKHLTLAIFYGALFTLYNHDFEKHSKRSVVLFKQFVELLQHHYKKEREVNFYADKLCITPKHLSVIIQEQSDKSAIRYINEYVLNECQAQLLSTNMSLQEISDNLHFPSLSVFSKFFKRMTGISPSDYRKQVF